MVPKDTRAVEYGGGPEFPNHHGHEPGGKKAKREVAEWRDKGNQVR